MLRQRLNDFAGLHMAQAIKMAGSDLRLLLKMREDGLPSELHGLARACHGQAGTKDRAGQGIVSPHVERCQLNATGNIRVVDFSHDAPLPEGW